ncbi:MAG: outer membrane beta-barrel protein [Bacteroidia bacterium]|nr:outer membrane beta-barrel protein [Bacteroidia bacterium]
MKNRNQALMRQCLSYIFLLLFLPVIGYSQEVGSCAEKLATAQSLFDKGQVEQVADIIKECMKSGFNREESLSAYKLLIQTYLFEDKLEKADSAMLDFLKKNPEYQLSPTDHSSFVHLFNSFKVKPVVQISVHLGTNLPFLTFIDPVTVSSLPGKSVYSSTAINLFVSAEAKFALNKKIELNFETGYSQMAFTNVEEFMGIGSINYTETQKRLELPVSATYNITTFGKFTPYGRIGFGPALTLGTTAKTSFIPGDINGTPLTGSDIDRKDSRISIDLFTQAGAGIKFKTRGGYIIVEVRSNIGILNQTVRTQLPTLELSSEELGNYYKYEDDDFHLNTLNFSIGYTQIFYKPSKRKE